MPESLRRTSSLLSQPLSVVDPLSPLCYCKAQGSCLPHPVIENRDGGNESYKKRELATDPFARKRGRSDPPLGRWLKLKGLEHRSSNAHCRREWAIRGEVCRFAALSRVLSVKLPFLSCFRGSSQSAGSRAFALHRHGFRAYVSPFDTSPERSAEFPTIGGLQGSRARPMSKKPKSTAGLS